MHILTATIAALLSPGRGILAADESFPTIEKRFAKLGIVSTPETRRTYRELLLTAPGLEEFICGTILFDETLRAKIGDVPVAEALAARGIVAGIKVDAGTIAFPGFPGEKLTQGLDGLRERLAAYRRLGARFTKWRAVFVVGAQTPTRTCLAANARALALFAALSQEAELVPIVEPEVLMEGSHSLAHCEDAAHAILAGVFDELYAHRVAFEHLLLKTAMVLPGTDCPERADLTAMTEATLRCLSRSVPAAVPGIVFLSGGQTDVAATERLNALCRVGNAPWTLSFSFGRALQDAALQTWKGTAQNTAAAQAALLARARDNSLALRGIHSPTVDVPTAARRDAA